MDVELHNNSDINGTENINNNTGNEETSSEEEKSVGTDEGKKNGDETPTEQCDVPLSQGAGNDQETKDNKKIGLVEKVNPDDENSKGTNDENISHIRDDSNDNDETAAKNGKFFVGEAEAIARSESEWIVQSVQEKTKLLHVNPMELTFENSQITFAAEIEKSNFQHEMNKQYTQRGWLAIMMLSVS
jgi:hypothetical protein